MLGDVAEMRVARRQLGPGIADADHRPAVEEVVRQTLVLHPAAMGEAVAKAAGQHIQRMIGEEIRTQMRPGGILR